jgi:hypothetical protein
MIRAAAAGLCVLASLIGLRSLGCGGDECAPTDFGGGQMCGEDDGSILACQFTECIEGPFCNERYVIREDSCPLVAPTCRQSAPGQVVCLGENIGPCTQEGFVRCDDAVTIVTCMLDERGQLFLSRGACDVGQRCSDPGPPPASGSCLPM